MFVRTNIFIISVFVHIRMLSACTSLYFHYFNVGTLVYSIFLIFVHVYIVIILMLVHLCIQYF
jgi:hypothetical protein